MSQSQDWERLGILAGFDESTPNRTSPVDGSQGLNIQIDVSDRTAPPLLDEEDLDGEGDRDLNRFSFMSSKLFKILAITLVVIGGLGIGLFTTMLNNSQEKTLDEKTQPTEIEPQSIDPEKADLKAQLGFKEQESQLKQINQPPVPKAPIRQTRPSQRQILRSRVSSSMPRSTPKTYRSAVPPTVTVPRTYARPSPPQRAEYRTSIVPRPTTVPAFTPLPKVAPQQAWLEASRLGSFGGDEVSKTAQGKRPVPQFDEELETPTQEIATEPEPEEVYPEEAVVLDERMFAQVKVPPGVKGRGVLETAIAWEGQTVPEDVYLIRLTEDLVDRFGEMIFPVDTVIFVSLKNARSGLIQLKADSVLLPDGTDEPIALPGSAFSIRRSNGSPLIAKQHDYSERERRGMNVPGLLFDVLSTAAGMTTGNSDNPYQNYYQMDRVKDIYDRNFAQPTESRPNTNQSSISSWELEAGVEVSLYVTKGFSFSVPIDEDKQNDF